MKGSFKKKFKKNQPRFDKKVILCNLLITYGSDGYEQANIGLSI